MHTCEVCKKAATELVWFMPGDTMLNAWVLCPTCAEKPLGMPGHRGGSLVQVITFPPQVFASVNFENSDVQTKVITAVISTLQELAGVEPS